MALGSVPWMALTAPCRGAGQPACRTLWRECARLLAVFCADVLVPLLLSCRAELEDGLQAGTERCSQPKRTWDQPVNCRAALSITRDHLKQFHKSQSLGHVAMSSYCSYRCCCC